MNYFTLFEIIMMVGFSAVVVFIMWPYLFDNRSKLDRWADEIEAEARKDGKL